MISKQSVIKKVLEKFEKSMKETEELLESTRQSAVEAPKMRSDTTTFHMAQLINKMLPMYDKNRNCILKMRKMDAFKKSDRVEAGALVKTAEDGKETLYFILPKECETCMLELEGRGIICASEESPVAKALLGKKQGSSAKAEIAGNSHNFKIIEIR